jgi:peptidoglycan hydrolase-like protein with peptidoglycan-binding domain
MNEIAFSNPNSVRTLHDADFQEAAKRLDVQEATIRAVAEVEASGSFFLPDGRPIILFEAHVFNRETSSRFLGSTDSRGVAIATRNWDRSLYGPTGDHQYQRLNAAMSLNIDAALRSASWGAFQIMGFNHGHCGFANVRDFVQAMVSGANAHLFAFCEFVRDRGLDVHLRNRDWEAFARGYNGPGHAQNNYVGKISSAYARWYNRLSQEGISGGGSQFAGSVVPNTSAVATRAEIVEAQRRLGVVPDGIVGPKTQAATRAFQARHGMHVTGVIGPLTLAALGIREST